MVLEHGDEARADTATLLLLADYTEDHLQEPARAVRLEDDRTKHTPCSVGLTEQHERLVVGREGKLRRVLRRTHIAIHYRRLSQVSQGGWLRLR